MGDAHDWLKDIGVSPASTLRMKRQSVIQRGGGTVDQLVIESLRRYIDRFVSSNYLILIRALEQMQSFAIVGSRWNYSLLFAVTQHLVV